MLWLYKWLLSDPGDLPGSPPGRASIEVVVLRSFGLVYLVVFMVGTLHTSPHVGLHGRGLAILLAAITMVVSAIAAAPQRAGIPTWRRLCALGAVTVASAVLAVLQPNGIWEAAIYYVGIVAALRFERMTGLLTIAGALVLLMLVSVIAGHTGSALGIPIAAIPWFLVMRLLRQLRDQRDALSLSRASEARAAAAAERGRLAREMHDVLAHSLSALALQLESTRLLARDRNADEQLTRAIDQAHHLAASGLEEARRAIAAGRGDELPGPERIDLLAEAFGAQSGLPVNVEVQGKPHELPPDARLAVYRTAQEALTNVRRHATPERVEVKLAYLSHSTVLVVADHAPVGTPPPVALGAAANGYGLTGMRERAKLLGGELLAEPTSDGFRVELRLPS